MASPLACCGCLIEAEDCRTEHADPVLVWRLARMKVVVWAMINGNQVIG